MIQADNFIEGSKIRLYNLCTNAGPTFDGWVSSVNYPNFTANLSKNIYLGRSYFIRCQMRHTGGEITRYMCYLGGGNISLFSLEPVSQDTTYNMTGVATLSYYYSVDQGVNFLNFYAGPSNTAITKSIQNVAVYDVTELRAIVETSDFRSWCTTNLPANEDYIDVDITSFIKPGIRGGVLSAEELVETDGLFTRCQTTSQGINAYFDSGNPLRVYNNSGGGTVTHERISGASQNSPFYPEHPYILKITTNGTASPGAGGFQCSHQAAANKVTIERFVAKVPVGYSVSAAYNAQGTGSSTYWITSRAGTGEWREYAFVYECGSTGSFSDGGHIYVSGSDNTNVTWYVAVAVNLTITDDPDLMNFQFLPNVDVVKGGKFFTRQLNNANLVQNGDFAYVPEGSSIDFDDVPEGSETRYSIVQKVKGGPLSIGSYNIDPQCRYKISFWSKGIRDMTSYLVAIRYYNDDGFLYTHNNTVYKTGTKQQLAEPLNPGDTSMTLKTSASNWEDLDYSHVGVRTSQSRRDSDHDIYTFSNGSTGVVAGNSGNVVNFKTAYTGETLPVDTWVCESRDGGNFPYPFGKGIFSETDNVWTYHEATFGYSTLRLWDGRMPSASGFDNIPCNARTMYVALSLYQNTGSQPLKFADVRVTPYNEDCGTRSKMVAMKGYTRVAPLPAKRAWMFDELVDGEFPDSKGVGNFIQVSGTTTCSKGIATFSNSALRADRAGFDFNGPFSISLWIKTSDNTAIQTLLQSRNAVGGSLSIFIFTEGKIRFDCGGNQLTGNTVLTNNEWHHIVCTYDGSVKSIWIDNSLDRQITVTHVDQEYPDYIWTGLSSSGGTSFSGNAIVGSLDDMRIYDKALTEGEVEYIYNLRGK